MLDFSACLKPSAGAFLAISRPDAIYHFEKSGISDFPFCTSKSPPKPFLKPQNRFQALKRKIFLREGLQTTFSASNLFFVL